MAAKRTWLWVLLAVGGACFLCSAGTVGLMALGAFADDGDASGGPQAVGAPAQARAGAPGGFSFTPPDGWTSPGPGRVAKETTDDRGVTLRVELIHLAAIAGVERPEAKLADFWRQRVGADWEGASERPLVFRRYVENGARAWFTSERLRPKGGGVRAQVTAWLVEAGDRLEPLVAIQSYRSNDALSIQEFSSSLALPKVYPLVEEALKGVTGSPVGLPLFVDAEVVGRWGESSSNALQLVNVNTGSTSMNAVAHSAEYTLTAYHHYTYAFQGASGTVGAMQVSTDKDQGAWRIEHDLLVLEGKRGPEKYLLVAAGREPGGRRMVYVLPKRAWSFEAGVIANGGAVWLER